MKSLILLSLSSYHRYYYYYYIYFIIHILLQFTPVLSKPTDSVVESTTITTTGTTTKPTITTTTTTTTAPTILTSTLPPDENYEISKNFIQSIRNHMNLMINPCDDFAAYSCQTFRLQLLRPTPRPDPLQLLLERRILNNQNLSTIDLKFRNYLDSCSGAEQDLSNIFQNVDILVGSGSSWPIDSTRIRFNSNTIIGFLARVIAIRGLDHFIEINLDEKMNLSISVPTEFHFPLPIEIMNLMKIHGAIPLEAEFAVDDIRIFMDKLKIILNKKNSIQSTISYLNITDVPEINWMTFFFTLFSEWNLDQMKDVKNIRIIDSRVKDIAKLIQNTEPNVIANFLIFKIVSYLTLAQENCRFYLGYFRPLLFVKVWTENLNNQDEQNYLQILDIFEKSFNQTFLNDSISEKNDIIIKNSRILFNKINKQRNFLNNYRIDFGNFIKRLNYDTIKIYRNNYYQNIFNIGKYFSINPSSVSSSSMTPVRATPFFNKQFGIKNRIFDDISNLGIDFQYSIIDHHNKPIWYYFTSKSMELWQSTFQENLRLIKTTSDEIMFCLSEQGSNATSIFETWDYINLYASIKSNYKTYLKWLEKSEKILKNDIEILNELNLDLKKIHFISVAQQLCLYAEQFDKTHQLYQILRNFDEFSKAFNCSSGSFMNIKDKCDVVV